uniref:Uncharacterized protein n=1 Tax=Mimivirus LCMiAC01 TaxID=2506608 RepID=A0A481Z021_9VIRU|nr:MAG: hypothetical protein LCMiAC01_05000 [Mimivirus LCMiAC01]
MSAKNITIDYLHHTFHVPAVSHTCSKLASVKKGDEEGLKRINDDEIQCPHCQTVIHCTKSDAGEN